MKTEFEARFFKYPKDIKDQLIKNGFSCKKSERIMKVKVFHFQDNSHKWARIRDEGFGDIRLSIKERNPDKRNTAESVREIELKINSFEKAEQFLKACGLHEVSEQEKKRESWENGQGVQVEFDTWPGLPKMIEIEGCSEKDVRKIAEKLGIAWNDFVGDIDTYIEKIFGIPAHVLNNMPMITFEKPLKSLLKK